MSSPVTCDAYHIGILCALPLEVAAVQATLDEKWEPPRDCSPQDTHYTYGRIEHHNVVIACLPAGRYGLTEAATLATNVARSFPLQFGLMVGIGGGVWSRKRNIRLGDIVVSQPAGEQSGILQWDSGKVEVGGFRRTGSHNHPPKILLNALSQLQAQHENPGNNRIMRHLEKISSTLPDHSFQADEIDCLYEAGYFHEGGDTCASCQKNRIVERPPRASEPLVFYGNIASGHKVVKDGLERDNLARQHDIICFEMEAAGLGSSLPSLIIRGISDYADSHKNDNWQRYAAATAAAYAKELLRFVPSQSPRQQSCTVATRPQKRRKLSDASRDRVWETDTSDVAFHPSPSRIFDLTESDEDKRRMTFHHRPQGAAPSRTRMSVRKESGSAIRSSSHLFDVPHQHLTGDLNEAFMDSLKFEVMDDRHDSISTSEAGTCKWLLETSEYDEWCDHGRLPDHHGFFWMRGKPGTGKSTMTKFILHEAKKKWRDSILVSFFFHARGDELQKSVTGLYRSLLWQILTKVPGLGSLFQGRSPVDYSDARKALGTLKGFLRKAVAHLEQTKLMCFIDALDEGAEDDVRDMVSFFEDLGEYSSQNHLSFSVFLSSRYYPAISIKRSVQLDLDDQPGHEQDIAHYIQRKLDSGKTKKLSAIKKSIQEKASGIFLWVVLVVDILNRDCDKGNVHMLMKRLDEIPAGLSELFSDMLGRDAKDKCQLLLTLQWILYAKRPLKYDELYMAILTDSNPAAVLEWKREDTSREDMEKFLLHYSKGLVGLSRGRMHVVQFIHESVRTFLGEQGGLASLDHQLSTNVKGISHDKLARNCCAYFSCIDDKDIPSKFHLSQMTANHFRSLVFRAAPFLEYSIENVYFHMEASHKTGCPQEQSLKQFPLKKWITLNNRVEILPNRFHNESATLVNVLAERAVPGLLEVQLTRNREYSKTTGRFKSPLEAAVTRNDLRTLEVVLEHGLCSHVDKKEIQAILLRAATARNSLPILGALCRQFAIAFHDRWESLVIAAIKCHKVETVAFMIKERSKTEKTAGPKSPQCSVQPSMTQVQDRAIHLKTRQMSDPFVTSETFLRHALENKALDIALFLMDHMGVFKGDSERVLQTAAEEGHVKAMEWLLDRGADVNAFIGHYGFALQAAARSGIIEAVRLLLDRGADVNALGGEYGSALQAATACSNDVETIRLLLNRGANVNAVGGFYGSALQAAAARHISIDTVRLLLDRGADVNALGGRHGSALQAAAAQYKSIETVRCLLDRGANINALGGRHGSALQAAAAHPQSIETVRLLLDHGADVNASGGEFGSALRAAVAIQWPIDRDVVSLLLDRGADIHARSGGQNSALQLAQEQGRTSLVGLLLKNDARTPHEANGMNKYGEQVKPRSFQEIEKASEERAEGTRAESMSNETTWNENKWNEETQNEEVWSQSDWNTAMDDVES